MAKFVNHFVVGDGEDCFGVVLVNLGTPRSPEKPDVRRFLRQFLSDTRVVELPKAVFWFILNGIILVIRPGKSAGAYRQIWTDEGSPLMVNSIRQVNALSDCLKEFGVNNVQVRCAMRYGQPSVASVLKDFGGLGIDRLFVLPMYPQYSGSTSGSVFDEFGNVLQTLRRVPALRFINHYSGHDGYIHSLATTVREHWSEHGRAQKLVLSFHGVPKSFAENGDPYFQQCISTAQSLALTLQLSDDQWVLCFQSRVGRQQWLEPYTEHVLKKLPHDGCHSIDVMCPGFSVDCLETLEEVNIGYRELFLESGGKSFNYIPCLNDHPQHIEFLRQVVMESAADWLHR